MSCSKFEGARPSRQGNRGVELSSRPSPPHIMARQKASLLPLVWRLAKPQELSSWNLGKVDLSGYSGCKRLQRGSCKTHLQRQNPETIIKISAEALTVAGGCKAF